MSRRAASQNWSPPGIAVAVMSALACAVAGLSLSHAAAPADVVAAPRVIHISVDGLGSSYLQQIIDAGQAPNFVRLRNGGASTMNARTDFDYSITLPNHTGILTGRPVNDQLLLGAYSGHNWVTNNTPPAATTLHNNIGYYIASAFDVAHDRGLRTALYASKEKFILYEQSYNATSGAPDLTGPDHGRDKIDVLQIHDFNTPVMMQALLADLAAQPADYNFVHFNDPDTAGHASGWGSVNFVRAVTTVDVYLGQILDLISNTTGLRGNTTIILSADHGGAGAGHSEANLAINYTIPFFVWGVGVPANADLYTLNGGDTNDPGSARPGYANSGNPIRNADGGNCAMRRLGLPLIPGSSIANLVNPCLPAPALADTSLIPAGSTWKYRDFGTDLGTAWREVAHDDAVWQAGPAPLGFGDPVSTTVNGGPAGARYMTTYFRKQISITSLAGFSAVELALRRDDGAVVYFNGVEVARFNMPDGAVFYGTPAASAAADDGASWFTQTLPLAPLSVGNNLIAVELHQADAASSDLRFDLRLRGSTAVLPTATPTATPRPTLEPPAAGTTRIAVIGDWGGVDLQGTWDVSNLVRSWNVDTVLTVGDNSYCTGTQWDVCVTRYYSDFIAAGRFFPALGNHDWDAGITGYTATFNLPHNERYYTLTRGLVDVFVIDSDTREPDGTTVGSVQHGWISNTVAASTNPWKLAVFHHPAYSSGQHGNAAWMQWDFAGWGIDSVLQGHDHNYERLDVAGLPYFVVGTGGRDLRTFASIRPQSVVRYADDFGALLIEATACALTHKFYTRSHVLIDTHVTTKTACIATATPLPTETSTPTLTPTPTHTPTPSATPTPASTALPEDTATHTAIPTSTATPTASSAQTATPASGLPPPRAFLPGINNGR